MRPLVALALALAPVPALAQQPAPGPAPSTCDVQIDTSRHSRFILQNGYYQTFGWGGVWAHCRAEPTTMYSDSVAWYPDRSLLYLVGNVRFHDSVTVLNADHVTYYLHQERLYAEGHVYTQNTRTRSDLRGNNLDYYRASPPLRDSVELFATQRPTIRFYPSNETAKSDTEPFVVVADRTHMKGSDEMWGGGNVTIDRSDLAARGDSAWLDLGHDAAQLLGKPVVNGTGPDAYHLRGDRLDFTLTPQHEVKRVLSSGHALGNGPDWSLDADTLDLALDSSKVQRAQAWGHGRRPDAVSSNHTIVADSLDIHMPGQLVRLVWAWGNARMVTRDTAARDTLARAAAAGDSSRRVAGDSSRRGAAAGPDSAASLRVAGRNALAHVRNVRARAAGDSAGKGGAARDTATARVAAADSSRAGMPRGTIGPRAPVHDSAALGTRAPARDSSSGGGLVGPDDWLLGDSLRADFVVKKDSATGKPRSELQHLTSFGAARALYHVESSDSARAGGCRNVNYSRGLRIDVATNGSKVQTVDVVGQTDGMYLECLLAARDTTHGADSTAADTSRAAADSTARPAAGTLRAAPAEPRPAAPDTSTRPAAAPPAAVKPKP